MHNENTAEEVVQDAFFSVYRHIDRIDTTKKFSTYLFEVAKNAAISHLRKHKATISLEDIDEISTDESIYERVSNGERREMIERALSGLSHKYQQVIRHYYFDDLSYEQISRKLGLPMNTVRTHLARAKAQLKASI